jgi:hypothetical protein
MEPASVDELIEFWTLLDEDRALLAGRRGATALGSAVLLKQGCLPVWSNHGLSNRDCFTGTGTLVISHADRAPHERHYSRIQV